MKRIILSMVSGSCLLAGMATSAIAGGSDVNVSEPGLLGLIALGIAAAFITARRDKH